MNENLQVLRQGCLRIGSDRNTHAWVPRSPRPCIRDFWSTQARQRRQAHPTNSQFSSLLLRSYTKRPSKGNSIVGLRVRSHAHDMIVCSSRREGRLCLLLSTRPIAHPVEIATGSLLDRLFRGC